MRSSLLLICVLTSACAPGLKRPSAAPWQPDRDAVPVQAEESARLAFANSPGKYSCDGASTTGDTQFIAHLPGGSFPLTHVWNEIPVDVPTWRVCKDAPGREGATVLASLGSACFVGFDQGEWGGRFFIVEKGKKVFEYNLPPKQVLNASGQTLVLSAYHHMGDVRWYVTRLLRDKVGQWSVEWVHKDAHSMLWGYGLDGQGRLLLMVGDDMSFGHQPDCFEDKRLYRLREDGRLELLRSHRTQSP